MGAIANVVKQLVPASYAALVSATNSYDYTVEDVQQLADYAKYRIYSTVVAEVGEATFYNQKEVRFLGLLTTIQFIPAAIDYWGDQLSSLSTTGTNESNTFFDHRPDLWKIFDKATAEATALGTDLGINVNAVRGVVPKVSYGDNGRELLVTSDPQDFPAAFNEKVTDYLIWDIVD